MVCDFHRCIVIPLYYHKLKDTHGFKINKLVRCLTVRLTFLKGSS